MVTRDYTYRGVAKGGPGRARTHPNVGCALPMKTSKNQNTLIEHSNTPYPPTLTGDTGQQWLQQGTGKISG